MLFAMSDKQEKCTFIRLWKDYGGWSALLKSGYLRLSLVVFVLYEVGLYYSCGKMGAGVDLVISVVPSLLGFSLASFAIFLTFGGEKFQRYLIKADTETEGANKTKVNAYMDFVAAFGWFLIIQTVSLLVAMLLKGYGNYCFRCFWDKLILGDFVGWTLFLRVLFLVIWGGMLWGFFYGVFQMLAICMRVYTLCRGYSVFTKIMLQKEALKKSENSSEAEN